MWRSGSRKPESTDYGDDVDVDVALCKQIPASKIVNSNWPMNYESESRERPDIGAMAHRDPVTRARPVPLSLTKELTWHGTVQNSNQKKICQNYRVDSKLKPDRLGVTRLRASRSLHASVARQPVVISLEPK